MDRFKGTPGEWELYGATRSVLHGLVDPDYYQIKCNHETIANNIPNKADARVMTNAKELLDGLQYAVKALKAISSFGATEPIIKQLESIINKATEV